MSKRQVSKQQSLRIQKLQAAYREKNDQNGEVSHEGLVISRYSRHALIEDKSGCLIDCAIRPNIESLVAGDQVIWQPTSNNKGVVVSCFPRSSILERQDKRGNAKPIAANVSLLVIVIAPKPEITWLLLDSYLVIAEQLNLPSIIVLNKIDLPCIAIKQRLLNTYSQHYPILYTSEIDQHGYDLLQQTLNHQTSVFVGQSGVGKSSLIANLLPDEKKIAVAEISAFSELGCHTTSNSRLYHLPTGGNLIDSPGIREFSLSQIAAIDIVAGFREFHDLAKACKFRNCNHYNSDQCALIEAVKQNPALLPRYNNLIALIKQYA